MLSIMAVFLLIVFLRSPAEKSQIKSFLALLSPRKQIITEEKITLPPLDKNKLFALSPLLSVSGTTGIDNDEENEEDVLGNLPFVQGSSAISITSPAAETAQQLSGKSITIYEVQSGDVPSTIANSFGISTNTVLWANNLRDGDYIRPGDELLILPVSGALHKIKSGDTVASIAKKYKADTQKIIEFNSLPADGSIRIGDQIIVPGGKISPPSIVYEPRYASALPEISGYFMRPISGGRKSQGYHPNNAVDLAVYCGASVYAAAPGVVGIADGVGWNGGYGKYVKINHPNKTATLYAHLRSIIIRTGQSVSQGQVIGYNGSTGRSTGCHVHFEVYGAKNPFI